jgi:hypothetical protein
MFTKRGPLGLDLRPPNTAAHPQSSLNLHPAAYRNTSRVITKTQATPTIANTCLAASTIRGAYASAIHHIAETDTCRHLEPSLDWHFALRRRFASRRGLILASPDVN